MTTKLSSFIEEIPTLKQVETTLQRIGKLLHIYSITAPPFLLQSSRVGYIDNTVLVLLSANGTTAASLRQQLPTLLAIIQKHDFQITGIRIEVQVGNFYTASNENKPRIERKLSLSNSKNLLQLADSLSDSPLKQAVKQLAGRAK